MSDAPKPTALAIAVRTLERIANDLREPRAAQSAKAALGAIAFAATIYQHIEDSSRE